MNEQTLDVNNDRRIKTSPVGDGVYFGKRKHFDILVRGTVIAPNQQLVGMDLMLWKAYLPRVSAWDHQLDVELLVSSLKKLIDLYPYLAGRICYTSTVNPFVIGNNKGVKFVCESLMNRCHFPMIGLQ